jgi:hypothetical protein
MGADDLMVSQKDVAVENHSMGEFAMSHRPPVSQVGNLATAGGKRGCWSLYVGELWDVATKGSFESVFAVIRGVQTSRAEVRATAKGGRGRWPFNTDGPMVFMADVALTGHSMSESTNGARIHLFLLNKRECTTALYLARQLTMFCKPD